MERYVPMFRYAARIEKKGIFCVAESSVHIFTAADMLHSD